VFATVVSSLSLRERAARLEAEAGLDKSRPQLSLSLKWALLGPLLRSVARWFEWQLQSRLCGSVAEPPLERTEGVRSAFVDRTIVRTEGPPDAEQLG